jgi:hypothetical protein
MFWWVWRLHVFSAQVGRGDGQCRIGRANALLRSRDHFHAWRCRAAYVKRLQSRVSDQEKALGEFKLYIAEHYASQEFLNDLKWKITDSLRELGRRIDHVFHPNRD